MTFVDLLTDDEKQVFVDSAVNFDDIVRGFIADYRRGLINRKIREFLDKTCTLSDAASKQLMDDMLTQADAAVAAQAAVVVAQVDAGV